MLFVSLFKAFALDFHMPEVTLMCTHKKNLLTINIRRLKGYATILFDNINTISKKFLLYSLSDYFKGLSINGYPKMQAAKGLHYFNYHT